MNDPGTIYSDDEVNCLSEEDDESDREIARNKIAWKKPTTFFDDLLSSEKYLDEISDGSKELNSFGDVVKYMDKKTIYDLNSTIQRVRSERNIVQSLFKHISSENDEVSCEQNKIDKLRVKERDIKKKAKKKVRKAQENERKLEKEKVELQLEDAPPLKPGITFLEMNLSTSILKAISKMGYQDPTPIQASTIPVALKGRDICGCAATGTGKTAAFMLPIIQRLIFRSTEEAITRVLALVPTRELGVQVYEVSRELAQFTNLNISLTVGGLNMSTQTEELRQNPDIIIATPGRLIDHIHNTPSFSLREIEILVLDEADRMLDEYFAEQLKEIVRQCCITRQTMLFSATMTDEVKDLVAVSLKNPVRIFVNNNTDVAQNLRQEFVRLRKVNSEDYRLAVLSYLLTHNFRERCIVFVQRKSFCHILHVTLGLLGIKCGELHGDLKQNERLDSLHQFKNKQINVLLATDVAARGLDIKGVQTVINYSVPDSYKTYVHRVGRTARAGFSGRSVTIAFENGHDYSILKTIQRNSLTPLYERVISKSNIEALLGEISKIKAAVDEVLALETAEKSAQEANKKIDNFKKKLVDGMKNGVPKEKEKKKWFQTKDESKAEKERLKLIIAGKLTGKAIKKFGKPKDVQKPKSMISIRRKNSQKFPSNPLPHRRKSTQSSQPIKEKEVRRPQDSKRRGISETQRSNFVKELTSTDPETIKRLKKAVTYDDFKEQIKEDKRKLKKKKN